MSATRTRQWRKQDIKNRLSAVQPRMSSCAVLDCNMPTPAQQRQGLNHHYCQRHIEHYRRHGSYSKPSYSAARLKPYRKAAHDWLKANLALPEVAEAINRLHALYRRSGQPQDAFRLTGKSPEERAANAWAVLRKAGVNPIVPLSVWIAVQQCHRDDLQPERKIEYRWVQAAKVIHRIAGGTHKRWERELSNGRIEVTEMHRYPISRGRVLRHIGQALEKAATGMLDQNLEFIKKDSEVK